MRIVTGRFFAFPSIVLLAVILPLCGRLSNAQSKDFNLELHANSHGTAADVGVPAYPGATIDKEAEDSSAADLGFTFGDNHFRLIVAKYLTKDSPERVLDFYRKSLSRYGEVLECNQGKPAGTLSATHSGLTCSGNKEDHLTVTDNAVLSGLHEIRAGSPHRFRIVAIDESHPGSTRFVLLYIETPTEKDTGGKSM